MYQITGNFTGLRLDIFKTNIHHSTFMLGRLYLFTPFFK